MSLAAMEEALAALPRGAHPSAYISANVATLSLDHVAAAARTLAASIGSSPYDLEYRTIPGGHQWLVRIKEEAA